MTMASAPAAAPATNTRPAELHGYRTLTLAGFLIPCTDGSRGRNFSRDPPRPQGSGVRSRRRRGDRTPMATEALGRPESEASLARMGLFVSDPAALVPAPVDGGRLGSPRGPSGAGGASGASRPTIFA